MTERPANLVVIRRRAVAVALGAVYYVGLLGCYLATIVPTYFGDGLVIRAVPLSVWCAGMILGLAPLLWMPLHFNRPSDFASWFLYLCVVLPGTMIPLCVSSRPPTETLTLCVALVAAFGLFEMVRRGRPLKLVRVAHTSRVFYILLPAVIVALALATAVMNGFRFSLSVSDIYERRASAAELIGSRSLMSYGVAFLNNVCVPFAIVLSMVYKKRIFWALVALAAIAVFSFNGQKSSILMPLLLIGAGALAARNERRIGYWLLGGFCALVIVATLEGLLLRSNLISAYLVRRQLVVPAQLTAYYWEYFSQNPFAMLSDSIFGFLFGAASVQSVSRTIGVAYFGTTEVSANANIWAAGYAHFGYCGVALASIGAGLVLRVADSTRKCGKSVPVSIVCAAIGIVWTNSALHTSILTGGVLMLLCGLVLLPTPGGTSAEERGDS